MSKLSDLNLKALAPERLARLRSQAVGLLAGDAALAQPAYEPINALAVLHTLALSPTTAPDALTLLHELQVYQVELELQAQELREARDELETALRRQVERHDHRPVGCYTVDRHLALQELNQTGADLLGVARDGSLGVPLDTFFCADSARRFRALLVHEVGSRWRASCTVQLLVNEGPGQTALASVSADPASTGYLVCLNLL